MGSWRSYTEQERAAAVGRALAVGAKKAGSELGIPRRTISSWLLHPTPAIQGVIVASEESITSSLLAGAAAGSAYLVDLIRDPKAHARDKVAAANIALQQGALWSGRPTARTETSSTTALPPLTVEEHQATLDFVDALVDASPEEIAEWAANGGLAMIRKAERSRRLWLKDPEEVASDG